MPLLPSSIVKILRPSIVWYALPPIAPTDDSILRYTQRHYADALPEEDLFRRVESERLTLEKLHETLWWLAFAVCLNFDKAYCLKVLELANNSELDSLFDRIAICCRLYSDGLCHETINCFIYSCIYCCLQTFK